MPLYLGLDCSTQGLTAIVIEIERNVRRVVFNSSLNFDRDFPEYGTSGGVRCTDDNEVVASPLMWADALDRIMSRLARAAEVDIENLRAISGAAQQHGSVYLNRLAALAWQSLDPTKPLAAQLAHTFSREMSPVWMDASTNTQCREIDRALGGAEATAVLTGSPACERFTGPQIRKFFQQHRYEYEQTTRIHLVSSFLASLLAGADASIDPGDGSGTNLMDIRENRWSEDALDATAYDLANRLPPIRDSWELVGTLSPYWQQRYSFPSAAIVSWTGDNPSSLIGTGAVHPGVVIVSLGTSDTVFTYSENPAAGSSHIFRSPTGDFMNLICFRNGSLAREWIRDEYGLTWDDVAEILDRSPGNDGRVMLPWLESETTPRIARAGLRRFGFDRHDRDANVRGLIEGQMMAIANQAAGVSRARIDRVIATGGASVNRAILHVMANVFGADVYRLEVDNSAALGAALRAYHADRLASGEPLSWHSVVSGFTDADPQHRVSPQAEHVAMYADLRQHYAFLERLHRDRDPIC